MTVNEKCFKKHRKDLLHTPPSRASKVGFQLRMKLKVHIYSNYHLVATSGHCEGFTKDRGAARQCCCSAAPLVDASNLSR